MKRYLSSEDNLLIIGIISNEDHCQSLVKGLAGSGFDVRLLGGDATSIPPSVKVLVVRTKSCSHTASAAAFQWSRIPGNHLIVENGLSGIRRKLAELSAPLEQAAREKEERAKKMEARSSTFHPALIAGLALESVRPAPLPDLPRIEDPPAPLPATPAIPEAPLANNSFPIPMHFPPKASWAKTISRDHISREVSAADAMFKTLDKDMVRIISESFENFRLNEKFFDTTMARNPKFTAMKGKPLRFLALILFCSKIGSVQNARDLLRAYYLFNGRKATNFQTVQAVAWATSCKVYIPPTPPKKAIAPAAAPTVSPPQTVVPAPAVARVSEDIVSLRDANAVLEQKVAHLGALVTALRSEFESLTAGLREFNRNTISRVSAIENSDADPRCTKLEEQNRNFLERLEELETRPTPPSAPPTAVGPDSLLGVLDAIRSRGGDITISLGGTKN